MGQLRCIFFRIPKSALKKKYLVYCFLFVRRRKSVISHIAERPAAELILYCAIPTLLDAKSY
jgi:hypothetical protein